VLTLSISVAAIAQTQGTPAPSIEMTNTSDLRHLCPGIDTALGEALGAVWHQVGLTSIVNVQMRVDGREVTFTRASGGPIE